MYLNFGKRLFDILTSIFSLLLLSPLLIAISLLIRLLDPGPVLFSHQRVGRNGLLFCFYKFRSMPLDTPQVPSDRLGDVRLSPIGKFIRRTSLDELPQLINILKGDMSFVGPRPPLPDQIDLIRLRQKNGSFSLRPGLTGLAQIRSFSGMDYRLKASYDATYAHTISFLLDLDIILQTFLYLVKRPPVY